MKIRLPILTAYVLILSLVLAVSVLSMPPKAYAVNVYSAADCSTDTGLPLVTPYTKDGTTYNCANDFKSGDTISAPNCGLCLCVDFSFLGGGAGKACLVPANIVFGTSGSASGDKVTKKVSVSAECDSKGGINPGNCLILKYITNFIKAVSALVGIIVVIMIIVGGIQYSSAGSDPQKVAAAKTRITNALIALVAYIFMFGFLQWLIPGGIF